MADCSLYEIHAFSNIFLKYPGCFPMIQYSQAHNVRFAFADKLVCIFSRVHRAILVFRSVDDEKGGGFFVKTVQSMRQCVIGLVNPYKPVGIGVVVL